jgi:hypothetical protein
MATDRCLQCLPSGRAADSGGHPGAQGIDVSGPGLSAEALRTAALPISFDRETEGGRSFAFAIDFRLWPISSVTGIPPARQLSGDKPPSAAIVHDGR